AGRALVSTSSVSGPSIASSNRLPWRTPVKPVNPRRGSAPATALPCGSRISGFGMTSTTTRAIGADSCSAVGCWSRGEATARSYRAVRPALASSLQSGTDPGRCVLCVLARAHDAERDPGASRHLPPVHVYRAALGAYPAPPPERVHSSLLRGDFARLLGAPVLDDTDLTPAWDLDLRGGAAQQPHRAPHPEQGQHPQPEQEHPTEHRAHRDSSGDQLGHSGEDPDHRG